LLTNINALPDPVAYSLHRPVANAKVREAIEVEI
jgi:hypothetical protein